MGDYADSENSYEDILDLRFKKVLDNKLSTTYLPYFQLPSNIEEAFIVLSSTGLCHSCLSQDCISSKTEVYDLYNSLLSSIIMSTLIEVEVCPTCTERGIIYNKELNYKSLEDDTNTGCLSYYSCRCISCNTEYVLKPQCYISNKE